LHCDTKGHTARCGSARSYACGTLAVLILAAMAGCVSVRYPLAMPSQGERGSTGAFVEGSCGEYYGKEIAWLAKAILSLGGTSDEGKPGAGAREARIIAERAVCLSLELANRYRLVRPPFMHNMLVNAGVRDRGLCHHWTNDLFAGLRSLKLKRFEFEKAVAYRRERREHNCVVVTPRGGGFYDGLVLDPWRYSGKLHAVPVREDTYPWQPRIIYLPSRHEGGVVDRHRM
jgi:hypothetical protein